MYRSWIGNRDYLKKFGWFQYFSDVEHFMLKSIQNQYQSQNVCLSYNVMKMCATKSTAKLNIINVDR